MAIPDRSPAARQRAKSGRALAKVALAMGAVVVLLVVAAVVWARTASFDRFVENDVLPRVSEKLGRPVTAESFRVRGLLDFRVTVEKLRVGGRSNEPIVLINEADVRFDPWGFLLSLGQHRELSSVELDGAHLNLTRLENGKWDLPTPPSSSSQKPQSKPPPHVDKFHLRDGTLRVMDEAKSAKVEVVDLNAAGRNDNSSFVLNELTGSVLGGSLRIGGRVDLSESKKKPWRSDSSLEDIGLNALPPQWRFVTGTLSAQAHLTGDGFGADELKRSMAGTVRLRLRDASWHHLALEDELGAVIGTVLKQNPAGAAARSKSDETKLGDLAVDLRVHDGWMELVEPVVARTSMGRLTLTGRVGLDQKLDLQGVVLLAPEFLSQRFGGKVHIPAPVPVRFRLGGKFTSPEVADVDLGSLEDSLPGLLKRLEEKLLSPFKKN